jgi:hypothetical protein
MKDLSTIAISFALAFLALILFAAYKSFKWIFEDQPRPMNLEQAEFQSDLRLRRIWFSFVNIAVLLLLCGAVFYKFFLS